MRVFKTRTFAKFAYRVGLSDEILQRAVASAERGLIDADLGGGVIKQRIARMGSGKSAGYRVVVLLRSGRMALFVYGFIKSERDNISPRELRDFKKLATEFFALDNAALRRAVQARQIEEITENYG